ncbi:MAG: dynamin family protein [Cyanobacteria bacterium P01_G01_bin.54]
MSPSSPAAIPTVNSPQAQRQTLADGLDALADRLTTAETEGEQASGKLELGQAIANLVQTSASLRQARFRILVLGDMKRGKSTLINALLGASVLPMDVNPCTAVLTVIRNHETPQVTIQYHDDERPATRLDIETFKRDYTIAPDEAKRLADQTQTAFPEVSQAVLDYPIDLLTAGVELIDTPGLNDTEARNQLVLDYLGQAQAVLFVLDATQPCTLAERRYLQNYLRDRGVPIFFAVNGWDRLRNSLVDPDDAEAVQAAEAKIHAVLQTQLTPYCGDRYAERVFPVSALAAYRRRLATQDAQGELGGDADLTGTGLPELLGSLDRFLRQERLPAELGNAVGIAQRAHLQVSESVARRLPLLDQNTEQLRATLETVEGEFAQLRAIRDRFASTIDQTRDTQAQQIADSFRDYLQQLEATFEADFDANQPDLDMTAFLDPKRRTKFQRDFKQAFERYMNDRLAAWEFMARQDLAAAFTELNEQGKEYQVAYAQVVDVMNQKLLGGRFHAVGIDDPTQDYSPWSDRLQDLFTAIPDYLNDTVRSFSLFWQQVLQWTLIYVCVNIALRLVGILFSSIALNIFGAVAITAGVVAVQAELVRRDFLKALKKEFSQHLPTIARDQWQPVYNAVRRCFEEYKTAALDRIDADIAARQGELDNLLHQKTADAVHRESEVKRLNNLAAAVAAEMQYLQSLMTS